ncbi:NAD-dependent epimerase/dehydratase family protein [Sediminicoccus rosea]|uniref:NAD(P)-dependent oxidoreductase n=1 Tax=Sediminicoccus rosea TaxID=1225128 RepID=A0ABZ0PCD8_9PROT|nr:NAD(P)-dependent oxidoreductase [Sediminicoccus rosea]WPB83359.1 NAD(P)-dependent oxidoreductase [Sediminicoccus rosea]
MRALVTGAGGFLGRHVVARLAEAGISVVTLGRGDPADAVPGRAYRIADLGDEAAVAAVLREAAPDLVFHLAGTAAAEPLEETYRVNVLFAARLLAAARRLPAPPRILLAGSAAEYGPMDEAQLPVSETAACQPVSVYGITKLAQTLHGLAAAPDLPVVVARLFNVIGGGMPGHLALGAFAAQIRAMPATGGVLRTGPLARERDFVEAVPTATLLLDLLRDSRAEGRVVNICSGRPTSLADLTAALVRAAGRPVEVQEAAGRVGNSDMIRHWGSAALLESWGYRLAPPDADRVAAMLLG